MIMGTKGREIVGMNVDELIGLLNRAYADEWLAYYQYWIGAKLVRGPMKDAVASELLLHATEELAHADMLTLRIIQLGGTPLLSPELWYKHTHCGYDAPTDPYVGTILKQNIKGEQCAITTYQSTLQTVKDKDPVTYNIVLTILQQEVEHEEDLQALEEDIQSLLAGSR
jgi:bacterioferritin